MKLILSLITSALLCLPSSAKRPRSRPGLDQHFWHGRSIPWSSNGPRVQKDQSPRQIDVQAGGAGKGMSDVLAGMATSAWFRAKSIRRK